MRLFSPDVPFRPANLPFYYGWVIACVGALGMAMSIPGQTVGVSVFTDHLLSATGLTRFSLSNAYLIGTLGSALLIPKGGSLLDRFGVRLMVACASIALSLTLVLLSQIDRISAPVGHLLGLQQAVSWVALTLGFVCLRFSGQGMLTLASRNAIGQWFGSRLGRVSAVTSLFVSFSFAIAPRGFSSWVERYGWRGAWLGMAGVVGIGMTTVAWLFLRNTPEACGLAIDGEPGQPSATPTLIRPFTRAEALASGAFWSVTLALAVHAGAITGFTFHLVDIGRLGGLAEAEAVTIFIPIAIVSTISGYLAGLACDRVPLKILVLTMMGAEAIALLTLAKMGDVTYRTIGIGTVGMASGLFTALSNVAMPRYFGRLHLGAISGAQMTALVFASALGPSLLAASQRVTGDYAPGLYACVAAAACVLILTIVVKAPSDQRSPRNSS